MRNLCRTLAVSICTALFAAGALTFADSDARSISYDLNIPSEELTAALQSFAIASHHKLLYKAELTAGKTSRALKGHFTAQEAIKALLSGTGLTFEITGSSVVLIKDPNDGKTGDSREEGTLPATSPLSQSSGGQPFRLAQENSPSSAANTAVTTRQEAASVSSGSERSGLAEIIVTAQKREERLIDVPVSIVALTGDDLQKRNITSMDDLQFVVPGLVIQGDGAFRTIFIRGISNGFGSSSLIGVYLDEADVTTATGASYLQLDLNTYDLDRVEVLRGPQGTLFGDGSAGGTIRFITKNPDLKHFAFNSDVAALFTQDGAPGERVQAMVNVPLIDNELGFRVAVKFDHEGGWVDQPAANQKDINGQGIVDVRIKGLWQPATQFTVSATAEIYRLDGMQNIGEDANGNYTQVFNLLTTPSVTDNFELYNLTATYDFDAFRVLSTTSYVDHRIAQNDYGRTFQFTPPGTPRFDEYFSDELSSSDLNEELRATSSGSGPWQWTVGGFYRHSRESQDLPGFIFAIPGAPGTPLPNPFPGDVNTTRSKARAVFGDTSYKVTDRLTLGTGVRYFEDSQNYTFGSTQTGKFHSLDPRVYAQFKLADAVNVYSSAAKGFRSGGFNSLNQPSYGPESVWTYELGTKMSLLEGRLSADAAVFYSNYTNYQIVGILPPPEPPLDITSNAGRARIDGIEWDVTWRPADQWSLSFNGDYLHDYKFTGISVTNSSYQIGDNLDFVSRYAFTTSAERDFIWNGKPGFVRLDYNQVGRETFRNRSLGYWYFSESDVTHMLNFNTSLSWNDNLRLGLFAQNLLNNRGYFNPIVIEANASRLRPRTIGVQFSAKF